MSRESCQGAWRDVRHVDGMFDMVGWMKQHVRLHLLCSLKSMVHWSESSMSGSHSRPATVKKKVKHLARNEARASDAYSMTESALNSRQSCCKRSENVMPKSWIPLLVGLVNLLRANPGDLIEHTNFSALKMRPWLQGVLLSFQNLRRRVKGCTTAETFSPGNPFAFCS